jgi:hypothetical protein
MTDPGAGEFRPPKSDGTVINFQFFILPPVPEGRPLRRRKGKPGHGDVLRALRPALG